MLIYFQKQRIGTEGHIEFIDEDRTVWVEGNTRRVTVQESFRVADQSNEVTQCVKNIRYLVNEHGLLVDDNKYPLAKRYLMRRNW